jgi:hypothetical protein
VCINCSDFVDQAEIEFCTNIIGGEPCGERLVEEDWEQLPDGVNPQLLCPSCDVD